MRHLVPGLAPLVLAFASSAGAATLMPFGAGTGELKLLDPAQPVSPSNPITVDTGLTVPDLESPITLFAATIDGTEARNIRQPKMAYIKHGQIFLVNLVSTASHAPARLSTIVDACELDGGREDFSDITKSWLKVGRAGPDGNCHTSDDRTTAVKINAGADAAGVTPAGMRSFDALHDPTTGAIVGFLTVEGTSPVALKRRGTLMNNPTLIVNLEDGNREKYERVLGDYFYRIRRLGDPSQLFRYQESTGQLHGPLHTFASSAFGGLDNGTHDAGFLYFGDGSELWRVPLDATDGAGAVRLTTVASNLTIQRIRVASGGARIVFQAEDFSTGSGALFSVPSGAVNATATTLKAPAVGAGVELAATGGDFVYFTTSNFIAGTISTTKVNADGSSPTTNSNTYWAGIVMPTRFDFNAVASPEHVPSYLIKGVRNADGSDTLRLVNPGSGLTGITLGAIQNVARGPFQGVFAFGLGRYAAASAIMVRGTNPDDLDTFVIDTRAANSVAPVLGTVGSDDHSYFGGG